MRNAHAARPVPLAESGPILPAEAAGRAARMIATSVHVAAHLDRMGSDVRSAKDHRAKAGIDPTGLHGVPTVNGPVRPLADVDPARSDPNPA